LMRGAERGLGITRLFAHPLNRYPALAGCVGDHPTPQAQALSERTLTVTTSPFLSLSEMDAIADLFESVLRGR
jgi:dTDP-4-amino-4,6-dideoxygalactose transaminase